MPIISVIMSTKDGRATLPAALAPFLAETLDIEVIVVSDGSGQTTRDYLDRLAREYPGRIKPIHLENGVGLTQALNLAAKAAAGAYLARQDDDDVSHPERLRRQLARFEADPALDILGTGNRIVEPGGAVLAAIAGQNFGNLAKRLLKSNVFCHGSLMMKRSALMELGGYDEFYRYSQDYDLVLRAVRAGKKLANLPDCLYDWTFSQHSISSGKAAEQAWYARTARQEFLTPGYKDKVDKRSIPRSEGPESFLRERQLMQIYLLGFETRKAREMVADLRAREATFRMGWRHRIQCWLPRSLLKTVRFLSNLRYRR